MSVIDNLIFDRTAADVQRVHDFRNRILAGGLNALTASERAEYLAGMKGAYNATDLNRVGGAVAYIAARMVSLAQDVATRAAAAGFADDPDYLMPYDASAIVVTAKQNWVMADVPTQVQAAAYLADLTTLRAQLTLLSSAPNVPASLDHLSYTVANNIERLLYVIDATLTETYNDRLAKIQLAVISSVYSGEAICGSN